ncbi:hypothetical protein DFJ74DRAFT_683055 [Hyaloraphidium curvatum]|nr:hypothetical protein DFJ74DRAFT_683055 [Hyaloraphidium curvatum]
MLRLHARIEDGVFFPAVETKRPGLADRFEEDHRRSAAGRPALLDLLNKAKDSDAAFEEAMAAMRRFCSGNTAHQLGEEQEINPKLPEDFTQPEAIHVVRMMAELDQPSFNGPYVAGVFSRIPDSGRAAFLTSLRMSVSAAQYEEIMKTVRGIVGDKSKQIVPVENPAMFV